MWVAIIMGGILLVVVSMAALAILFMELVGWTPLPVSEKFDIEKEFSSLVSEYNKSCTEMHNTKRNHIKTLEKLRTFHIKYTSNLSEALNYHKELMYYKNSEDLAIDLLILSRIYFGLNDHATAFKHYYRLINVSPSIRKVLLKEEKMTPFIKTMEEMLEREILDKPKSNIKFEVSQLTERRGADCIS